MRGAPSPGNDDVQAALNGRLAIVPQPVRRAVRADDLGFMGDPKLVQDQGGVLHRRPVALRPHDDADLYQARPLRLRREL